MKIVIVLLTTLVSLSALAHHNYRLRYDYDTIITLNGVVTKFDWKNPHVDIFMDVEDENGQVTNWIMPTGAPGVLNRSGVTADTLQPGDKVVISGGASRNGSSEMRARSMTLEDGSWFWLSPGGPPDGWPGAPADYQPVERGGQAGG